MLELLKGFKAESVESVVTGVNFLIRYGILWVQFENKSLIEAFYNALNELFIDSDGKYVPYAMYITKGLLAETEKEALLVEIPEKIIEQYNSTKTLWLEEMAGDNE
jgi:hypothetical protein